MRRLLLTACLIAAPTLALAHEFFPGGPDYPPACCNAKDCRPLAPEEVEWTPDGYRFIPSGQIIPFDAVPFGKLISSPDAQFHACTYQTGAMAGQVRIYGAHPCFWAPEAGT